MRSNKIFRLFFACSIGFGCVCLLSKLPATAQVYDHRIQEKANRAARLLNIPLESSEGYLVHLALADEISFVDLQNYRWFCNGCWPGDYWAIIISLYHQACAWERGVRICDSRNGTQYDPDDNHYLDKIATLQVSNRANNHIYPEYGRSGNYLGAGPNNQFKDICSTWQVTSTQRVRIAEEQSPPQDLIFQVSTSLTPTITLSCPSAGLNGEVQTILAIAVYALKKNILHDCHQLSLAHAKLAAKNAATAATLRILEMALRNNDHSLEQTLAVFLRESEDVIDNAIQLLRDHESELGPDGMFLANNLRAISLLRNTACFSGWTFEGITQRPQEFSQLVESCKNQGQIGLVNYTILKALISALSEKKTETPTRLAYLNTQINKLIQEQAHFPQRESEIDTLANSVLNFLARVNTKAYSDCRQFINWGLQ